MSALTKSWLQKQITDLEATRDEITLGLDEDGNNTLAALKLALAGMEAEPAYFINRVKRSDAYGDDIELRTYCYELDALKSKDDFGGEVVPLYAAPQPATAVLDASVMADNHISWLNENFPRKTFTDEEWEEVSLYTWLAWRDACRSAMQGKAEPVSNRDELPVTQFKPVADLYGISNPSDA